MGGFCSGVNTGVVGEFREGEEFSPIILMHRGVGAEVLFEFLVNTFGLTVRLRMVGGGQGLINPQRGTKRSGEFGGELSPTVGDEFTWETKAFPHMIAIEKGRVF